MGEAKRRKLVPQEQISARQISLRARQLAADRDRLARQHRSNVCAPRGTARWPSPAFRPILLITSLSVATAGVADAQTIIGPGTVNGTQMVSGGAATVVGNTTISAPGGDGIDAPPLTGSAPR